MKNNAKKIIYWLLAAAVCMGIPVHAWADPTCEVKIKDAGPPLIIEFIFQETQVGLKNITVKEVTNFLYDEENFLPGTTSPITYTFTQLNGTTELYAEVEATDMNDRTTTCTYPSTDPPQCSVTEDDGPPFTVTFTIVDETEGLKSITVKEKVNATVDIPPFTSGTFEPVDVTAQKENDDEFEDFAVTLTVEDMIGNKKDCAYDQQVPQDTQDPQVTLTNEDPGPPIILEITAQDSQSGIETIEAIETINADVQIPAFTVGTTDPVKITASQENAQLDFSVAIEVVDRVGNKTTFRYETTVNQLRPEIDRVGQDDQYLFKDDWVPKQIFSNGRDAGGTRINRFSDFPSEFFDPSGQASADSCYSTSNRTYLSVLTPTWSEGEYEWEIVLQMQPATDLMLIMLGCVLITGEDDVWSAAYQTGFYTTPWNQPVFLNAANLSLTAIALPGPMASDEFPAEGFILDTKRHPSLQIAPLEDSLITVQAFASESIVIALPSDGGMNAAGQTTYSLSQGDRIRVIVRIPGNTTVDVRFGEDGAILQYIGKKGTEYTNNP